MQPLISHSADSVLSPGFRDAAYLRIASLAIGGYELICTFPATFRFYRSQNFRKGISQQFFLFVLIRYLSIAVIVISNVGFFGQFSSLEACRRFMLVSPIFKALQTAASQTILSTRTYTLSRRSRWVFWTMLSLFLVVIPLEFFADIYKRTPVHNPTTHNCTSGNASLHRIAWVNYAVAMVFDLIAICISTGYLWFYSSTATRISHFIQILLYEGLGYFVVLTAVNIFNLVLYLKESESTQSTGASLGYVIIFIMSQRILIKQKEYAEKYAESERSYEVTLALDTTREINNALRSQFETTVKSSPFIDTFAVTSLRSQSTHPGSQEISQSELDVQVRIEQTVVVERNAAAMRRESYRTPRVLWGSRA